MSEGEPRSLDLPPVASSTRAARHFVDAALADWGLQALRDTVLLLTSEVVTNSILHARSAVRLEISHDARGVAVEVSDGSPRRPIQRRQSDDATTGRGVDLLDQLASEWTVHVGGAGKTLRFTVAASGDPWAAYTGTNWVEERQ
jgi:anti-sigma regulatory factor (Ser/Thr protein kinase)